VLRRLKQQLDGEIELHYLCKSVFATIVEANPYVDKVWSMVDKDLDGVLESMKDVHYDYIIDLHRNLRSARTKRRLESGMDFMFKKYNYEKWLLVNLNIDRMPKVHIVDRYMETIKAFGTSDDGKGLDYFISEGTAVNLKPFGIKEQGYLTWVIGAAHPGKRFSADKVARVISQIDRPIMLLGGKADIAMAEEIMTKAQGHVINMVGRTNLHESAWLINHAQGVITPDTGMMHIASALKKPILSLWGCTVPAFGMYPYRPGEGSQIVEPVDKQKRPCSKLGDRCKYPENCIESIDEQAIIDWVSALN